MAFFKKKILENYISKSINVGFYQHGPALTLEGMLTARKRVVLIDHISISALLPPSHTVKKEFNWFSLQPLSAFRSKFDIVNAPKRFTLSANNPHKYSIMFVDNTCYSEIKTTLLNIIAAWKGLQEHHTPQQEQEGLFKHFCRLPITNQLDDFLRRSCYWQVGEYKIDICVTTKDERFITRKRFFLNEEDVKTLKNNSSDIISSVCSQPSVDYHTIQTELMDLK